VKLNGVLETVYDWKTSNGHSGIFTSAPRPGYKTSKNGGVFTFLTSSCIIPHFPYNPMDHPLSILGFKHLANLLPSLGAQFMLFLGDFIYADVPLTFGSSVEDFRRDYRQVYASPDWPAVGQNLSWIHVLDDHEISNDFDNNMNGTIDPLYKAAADPWHHYQAAANPPQARAAGTYNEVRKDATYFEFTQGPATFFMMDTRKYRDKIYGLPPNSTVKTMLGEKQLADLLAFLGRPVPKGVKWKVIFWFHSTRG
jgi:alkaline phosphatase D